MTKAYLTRRPTDFFADPFFRSLDQFFGDEPFRRSLLTGLGGARDGWVPAVDVRETDESFVFTAELPGLTKDDVSITLEDNVLTLTGERRFENEENKAEFRRIERSYGRFTRSFTLPHEVDNDKVGAKYGDGVLTVTVPKTEKTKPRKIEIS
ncbi:MAG: Hsp20/alpha crystallin family protein [bacterium]|nr:Hsp20/alpha crystallin family protein [bacterium]